MFTSLKKRFGPRSAKAKVARSAPRPGTPLEVEALDQRLLPSFSWGATNPTTMLWRGPTIIRAPATPMPTARKAGHDTPGYDLKSHEAGTLASSSQVSGSADRATHLGFSQRGTSNVVTPSISFNFPVETISFNFAHSMMSFNWGEVNSPD